MTDLRRQDPLSALAPLLRVRPELRDFCQFGGVWAAPHGAAAGGSAHFHIVTRGRCLLARAGHAPLRLETGDILLLPHGDAHDLRALEAGDGAARPRLAGYRNAIRLKVAGEADPDTELICGVLHFDDAPINLPIAALPDLIVVRRAEAGEVARFQALIGGIRDELDAARAGASAIATDLASALFVMLLRAHLEAHPPAGGLLALLAQRPTALAVTAMLRDPGLDWRLDDLAAAAATSRATLVRLFRRTSGLAPLAFLTELRLSLGRQRLARTGEPIVRIAVALGYQSEASFSRAIHRRFGVRPGSIRSAAAREPGAPDGAPAPCGPT